MMTDKKIGLVLEGGALRGLFTAGVLDVFMEQEIEIPAAVGVSAGAAFGCNYKSRQIGRVLGYNTAFCNDPRYFGMRSLLFTGGLFNVKFCYDTIPNQLYPFDSETYNQNPMDFYMVATDIETGEPFYPLVNRVDEDCFRWIRASSSMPLVSRPVKINGRKYLDGGISDSIPIRFMLHSGYEKNVVILTQPRDFVKQPTDMAIFRLMLGRYKGLLRAMQDRHLDYNESRRIVFDEEAAGRALVILPDQPLPVSRTDRDPEHLRQAYAMGRRAAEQRLDELRQFISA